MGSVLIRMRHYSNVSLKVITFFKTQRQSNVKKYCSNGLALHFTSKYLIETILSIIE